ncbi:hydroxysqualene dehydroxylase HpnE [Massilia sp. Leaf139]|uniref:hydroxysqualene dehydroxylase HpnE n=1 Tax=Massilia sp. Leaf139 TaxID=1736272 RepID=UPI0006F5822D|nr:hydroxysqualene dehydroxylase HpnE [Massilia sp. Leaf139]KQQ97483.1 phytoene dehydrogenase [Massilia sp. Leaf139]
MSATKGSGLGVAVVGGGWAGCAAAVELARRGAQVTLFEAARTLGGRARQVEVDGRVLDNGQHILLGAYKQTLGLLKRVGVEPGQAILRLPLQMRYPPGAGGMDLVAPRLPAPWHMLVGLLRAKGLAYEDKKALAQFSSAAKWMGWRLDTDVSVSTLLERFGQTERVQRLMWHPLCLAALNTAPERASANVFLAVLRDSLGARRSASDMLIPRLDLGALFPQAAGRYLASNGGKVHLGAKVTALTPAAGKWELDAAGQALGGAWRGEFDAVVLATPPAQTGALLAPLSETADQAAQLAAFEYEPIATCYLQYAPGLRLPHPLYALLDAPGQARFGQFVFDRGQLDTNQAGLLAVVISAAGAAAALDQEALARACAAQLGAAFPGLGLDAPQWSRVITEKRATFACTPGLARPANATALPGLVLAGDYTASEGDANYPATLESAVRSGQAAAAVILRGGSSSAGNGSLSHAAGKRHAGSVQ